jgi:hypothetical protein
MCRHKNEKRKAKAKGFAIGEIEIRVELRLCTLLPEYWKLTALIPDPLEMNVQTKRFILRQRAAPRLIS